MQEANLKYASFTDCRMEAVDMRKADLESTHFTNSFMNDVSFIGARFRDTHLKESKHVAQVSFKGTFVSIFSIKEILYALFS